MNTTLAREQSSKSSTTQKPFYYYSSLKHSLCFLTTFITLLLFFQLQALKSPSYLWPFRYGETTIELNRTRSMLRDSVTFIPLKDLRFAKEPMSGHTWFMSSMNDTFEDGDAEYLHFPSQASKGRLLCLSASDVSDGTKNSYALAWPEALPYNSILLSGLTFVSDTYYDYNNIWHGLSAIIPFVSWHQKKDCVVPARWVLFHWGELRTQMGTWVRTITEAAIGKVPILQKFDDGGPTCFEEAVVFRHNHGAMPKAKKVEMHDAIRCKARAYCNAGKVAGDDAAAIRMTLFLRTGARSFRNETAVIKIFEEECRKVVSCRIKVERPDNLTFCEQVKLLSETDILVTPHGAQLTNLFFMDKNSSVMEFYPKGWKEMAGVGQYVYRWLADWSGMQHQGSWWDPDGEPCPDEKDKFHCFAFYKDRQIGHDEVHFAGWAAKVLQEVKGYKRSVASGRSSQGSASCKCS
ncbi:uncharacterized protein [Typha latifolia]|uniref:uncharacterized protein n=1 Tax=Typha latifolia TaxID=4733 RepID=UPI003C2D419C